MNIIEKIKARAREAKEGRAITRQEKEAVRAVERKAYQEERLVVAVKNGKERARQPTGFKAFTKGLENISKSIDKIAPPQKSKKNQPTMTDVFGGTKQKKEGSMLDFKF